MITKQIFLKNTNISNHQSILDPTSNASSQEPNKDNCFEKFERFSNQCLLLPGNGNYPNNLDKGRITYFIF